MSGNLDMIFKPKTVAVIGASNKPGSIGNVIVNNLLRFGCKGKIYPVNPKADKIEWLECYRSVLDIPGEVDLAIIVVPRDFVAPSLEQCGQKGVKGVVTITAGFKEIGGSGIEKEQELLDIVRKYKMRMVGPNCYGVFNTNPDVSLNCTFSKLNPLRGKAAFMSQSGALGEVVIDYTNSLNFGFTQFASVGNKADISDIDILQYWRDDIQTEMILLYLENIEKPQDFTRLARQITPKKPIFAVKSGRTESGAKAIGSHTGVLAGGDKATDAVFKQCGIIRAESMDELFDITKAFASQPLIKGDRVAVITNAGGPGILATDAVERNGLKMARFEKKTIAFLKDHLPPVAALHNPIDVIASGGPDAYGAAVEAVLKDKNVDGVIVIFVPPILVDSKSVLTEVVDRVSKFQKGKTVLSCLMGAPQGITGSELLTEAGIPDYLFPESGARALAAMREYQAVLYRPKGKIPEFKSKKSTVGKIISKAAKNGSNTLLGLEALNILKAYGINIAKSEVARDSQEIKRLLTKMKLPVAMKIDDPEISHKSDLGGVAVGLQTKIEVVKKFNEMKKRFTHKNGTFGGVLLQEMVSDGVETIIGMNHDATFGPLMMFGLGGIHVELLKDVVFRVHPIADIDAETMIKSVKSFKLLSGFRGSQPVDIETLKDTLLKLSALITDFPEIKSLDINPYISGINKSSSKAVDARVILG